MPTDARSRRRQPRPHPGAGCPREQPQRRQRRDPEAPPDGVHRGLRIGQVEPRLRHDRRRVAAADQRDLQRVRPGIHAEPEPPGRRPARRTDHRHPGRPGADGRQLALDGRHGDRLQRDAAGAVQPPRQALHRVVAGVLVQHPVGGRRRRDRDRAGGRHARRRSSSRSRRSAACARAARAWARSPTSISPSSTTTASRSRRARSRSPATRPTAGACASSPSRGSSTATSRSATSPRRCCRTSSTRSRPRSRSAT